MTERAPALAKVIEQVVVGSVAVQLWPAPAVTVTVPVGVPAPGAATDSVNGKATLWPTTEGFTDWAFSTRLVAAALTVWLRGALVLESKLASPG